MLLCVGCEWHLKKHVEYSSYAISVDRYDLLETKYLRNKDYTALIEITENYPVQTKILVENILAIGHFENPNITNRLYSFFQDSTLKAVIEEVRTQYGNMDDINNELSSTFMRLKALLPEIKIPVVYTQVGALNQSIIVCDGLIGICLDKYLGAKFPLYEKYYPEDLRKTMERSMIVPDCILFYLLSCYPQMDDVSDRNLHKSKIQWIVNKVTSRNIFVNDGVLYIEEYMKRHKELSITELLNETEMQ